jgi:sugar diacid utilization regulator
MPAPNPPARLRPVIAPPRANDLRTEPLREVHARMVDAVLSGDRMRDVAAIAAERAGVPVAVILPELGQELVEPSELEVEETLAPLRDYVGARLHGRPASVPASVLGEVPVDSGGTALGAILLLRRGGASAVEDAQDVLHLAAMAAMTDLALAEREQQVEDELRGSFLEELRAGAPMDAREVVRRAQRLGCRLARGAVILAGEPPPDRAHRFMAAIKAEAPEAFVQRLAPRVYAVLPAPEGEEARERTVALASALARRLQGHAPVGISSFQPNPAELGRAIGEADLIVDVAGHSDLPPERLTDGTYRLLLQMLSSHPSQLEAYLEETVGPLARYDEQYRTDLVATLETYLDHDCRLGAAASALYAHRHTVAYRLERIRELTGLDPARHEHRERLGLGLKVHRLMSRPTR